MISLLEILQNENLELDKNKQQGGTLSNDNKTNIETMLTNIEIETPSPEYEYRILLLSSCKTCFQNKSLLTDTMNSNQTELFRAPICNESGLQDSFLFGKNLLENLEDREDINHINFYCSPMPSDMITAKMISLGVQDAHGDKIKNKTIDRIYYVIKPTKINNENKMRGGIGKKNLELYKFFYNRIHIFLKLPRRFAIEKPNGDIINSLTYTYNLNATQDIDILKRYKEQLENNFKTQQDARYGTEPFYIKQNFSCLEVIAYNDYWFQIKKGKYGSDRKFFDSMKPDEKFMNKIKELSFPTIKINKDINECISVNLYDVYNNPTDENKKINEEMSKHIHGIFIFEVKPLKIEKIKIDEDEIEIKNKNEKDLEELKALLKKGNKVEFYFRPIEFVIKLKLLQENVSNPGHDNRFLNDVELTVTNMLEIDLQEQFDLFTLFMNKFKKNQLNVYTLNQENPVTTDLMRVEFNSDDFVQGITVPTGFSTRFRDIFKNELLASKCGCFVHPYYDLYCKDKNNSDREKTVIPLLFTYQEWMDKYNEKLGWVETKILKPIKNTVKNISKDPEQFLSKKYGSIYNITKEKSDCYAQKINELFEGLDINESYMMGLKLENNTFEGIEGYNRFRDEIHKSGKFLKGDNSLNVVVVNSDFIRELMMFKNINTNKIIENLDYLDLKLKHDGDEANKNKLYKKEEIVGTSSINHSKNTLRKLVKGPLSNAKKFINCNYSYKKDVQSTCKVKLLSFIQEYNTLKPTSENLTKALAYISSIITEHILKKNINKYFDGNDFQKNSSLITEWKTDPKPITSMGIILYLIFLIQGIYDIDTVNFHKKNNIYELTSLFINPKSEIVNKFFEIFKDLVNKTSVKSKLLSEIAIKIYEPLLNIHPLNIEEELEEIRVEMKGKAIGKIPFLFSQSRKSNTANFKGKVEKAITNKITENFYKATHQNILDKIKILSIVKCKIHEFLDNETSIQHLHFKLDKFNDIIKINYSRGNIRCQPVVYYKAKRTLNTYKDGPNITADSEILHEIQKGETFRIADVFKMGDIGKVVKFVFKRANESDFLTFNEDDLEPQWTAEEVSKDKSLLDKSLANSIEQVKKEGIAESAFKIGKKLLKEHLLSTTPSFGITDYHVCLSKLSPENKLKLLFEIQKHNLDIDKDLLTINNIDLISSMDIIKIIERYTDCFLNPNNFENTDEEDNTDYTKIKIECNKKVKVPSKTNKNITTMSSLLDIDINISKIPEPNFIISKLDEWWLSLAEKIPCTISENTSKIPNPEFIIKGLNNWWKTINTKYCGSVDPLPETSESETSESDTSGTESEIEQLTISKVEQQDENPTFKTQNKNQVIEKVNTNKNLKITFKNVDDHNKINAGSNIIENYEDFIIIKETNIENNKKFVFNHEDDKFSNRTVIIIEKQGDEPSLKTLKLHNSCEQQNNENLSVKSNSNKIKGVDLNKDLKIVFKITENNSIFNEHDNMNIEIENRVINAGETSTDYLIINSINLKNRVKIKFTPSNRNYSPIKVQIHEVQESPPTDSSSEEEPPDKRNLIIDDVYQGMNCTGGNYRQINSNEDGIYKLSSQDLRPIHINVKDGDETIPINDPKTKINIQKLNNTYLNKPNDYFIQPIRDNEIMIELKDQFLQLQNKGEIFEIIIGHEDYEDLPIKFIIEESGTEDSSIPDSMWIRKSLNNWRVNIERTYSPLI